MKVTTTPASSALLTTHADELFDVEVCLSQYTHMPESSFVPPAFHPIADLMTIPTSPSPQTTPSSAHTRRDRHLGEGYVYGFLAYFMWGLIPIYFKSISQVSKLDILGHRITWSVPLLVLLLAYQGKFRSLWPTVSKPGVFRNLFLCAVLLSTNWYFFLYATLTGQIMQTSLGYFIVPLVNILLGVLFLGERLRGFQIVSVGLAAVGVTIMAVMGGVFPSIAIFLAVSFGLYGLIHKLTPVDNVMALLIEMLCTFPLAFGFIALTSPTMTWQYWSTEPTMVLLLLAGGLVTTIPLLLFITAAGRLPMVSLGMMQYIAPFMQFFLAWLMFGEAFPLSKQLAFGFTWLSLLVFAVGTYVYSSTGFRRQSATIQNAELTTGELSLASEPTA